MKKSADSIIMDNVVAASVARRDRIVVSTLRCGQCCNETYEMQMTFDRTQKNNLKSELIPASTVFCFNKGNIRWTYGNWSDLASVQTVLSLWYPMISCSRIISSQLVIFNPFLFTVPLSRWTLQELSAAQWDLKQRRQEWLRSEERLVNQPHAALRHPSGRCALSPLLQSWSHGLAMG